MSGENHSLQTGHPAAVSQDSLLTSTGAKGAIGFLGNLSTGYVLWPSACDVGSGQGRGESANKWTYLRPSEHKPSYCYLQKTSRVATCTILENVCIRRMVS